MTRDKKGTLENECPVLPLSAGVTLRNELKPGDIGAIVRLHGELYAVEYGWDHTFEAYVAEPLAKFAINQQSRERIWVVERNGVVAGSIAIVSVSPADAQLRWLLLHPELRGVGLARTLMDLALNFCRQQGYESVFLWTEGRLRQAAALYRSVGFELTESVRHELWGDTVEEQRYELRLDA